MAKRQPDIAPPDDLKGAAKARWLAVAPAVASYGPIDSDRLATYCNAYARWRQAEDGLAKSGPLVRGNGGRLVANPLVAVSRQAGAQVQELEKRLGLDAIEKRDDNGSNLVTRRQLADVLGVHMQTITKWEREGLPIAERGRRGRPSRYDLGAIRAWRQAKEAAGASGGSAFQQYQAAHARQRSALAELAELQLEERRGRLVDAQVMHTKITDVIVRSRTKLLGVPSKAKLALPHLTTADVLTIDRIMRESLEDLASMLTSNGTAA